MMRTVIGIVLICTVQVVLGDTDGCISPIDLSQSGATCGHGVGRPKLMEYGNSFVGTVSAQGPIVVVVIPPSAADVMKFRIGDHEYKAQNFHFHIGKNSKQYGSQHTQNGNHHDMEMHLSLDSDGKSSPAVLTFFVDEQDGDDNSAFVPLTSTLKKDGDEYKAKVNLKEIVSPAIDNAFYQYEGGHIGPPCVEVVLWTIYQTPLIISKTQMSAFRDAVTAGVLRPIQPLNGRTLYYDPAKPCVLA